MEMHGHGPSKVAVMVGFAAGESGRERSRFELSICFHNSLKVIFQRNWEAMV